MIVYIAGPITGQMDYIKEFAKAERNLKKRGHIVINPSMIPPGLKRQEDYMEICYPMISASDAVYMLDGYEGSKGAQLEYEFANRLNKKIYYQREDGIKQNAYLER